MVRRLFTTKQQVIALLAPVGGVLQEVANFKKVDTEALASRCGEVIAVATEIATSHGVGGVELSAAVKRARRMLKDGLQDADIKSKNGRKV